MPGFAVIDNQPCGDHVAVWIVGQSEAQRAGNVNAVTINRHGDPERTEKLRSLTRTMAVVLTDGSTRETLPIQGEALTMDDVEDLVRDTEEVQHRIVEDVHAYARRTRSKALTPPVFEPSPKRVDFVPAEDTATQRAFQAANFLNRVWTAWLRTDEQRRRRTVRPKTNETPWMMPDDMASTNLATFPPAFAARVQPQPQV